MGPCEGLYINPAGAQTGASQRCYNLLPVKSLTLKLVFLSLALTLGACNPAPSEQETTTPLTDPDREFTNDRLVKSLGGDGIREGWAQQTLLHRVFIKKYDSTDKAGQKELRDELDKVYFTANPVTRKNFEDALAEDPAEPANYVSYGYYLLPKRDEYENSLNYIQKGITMEEDNPAWQFLMAYAYVAPLRCGDFYRFGSIDQLRWKRYEDKYEVVIRRAARLWSENWFVPYFMAVHQYRVDKDLEKCWKNIIEGNSRAKGYFVFVPPLPLTINKWGAVADRDEFFDLQWHFGLYSYTAMQHMADAMLEYETFVNDPERLWGIMVFLFQASETRPLDRIYHYHIGQALKALKGYYGETGDEEKAQKLEQVLEFYNGISATLRNEFELSGLPLSGGGSADDPELLVIERSCRRQENIIEPMLKLHARLLKQVRGALDFSASDHPIVTLQWDKE